MTWKKVRLRDISHLITKGTTPTTLGYKFTDYGINFIKAEAITSDGRFDKGKFVFIDRETNQALKRSMLAEDDVLFTMAGVIARTAVVTNDVLPANVNQAIGIIRLDKTRVEPRYIHYLIKNRIYNNYINSLVAQSAQPNFNLAEIGNLPISLPPLSIQRRIVDVLGGLDDKIGCNRRTNQILEAMAKTLYRHWFIGAGKITEEWVDGSILDSTYIMSGGTPSTAEPAYWNGEIQWASAKDVSQCGETFLLITERTITQHGLNNSATQMVPSLSTVVVARGATTGRFAMFGHNMAMNQTCYALRSRHGHHYFLYCWFGELINQLTNAAHGSVFDTITTATFQSTRVSIPPVEMSESFNARVAPYFEMILSNQEQSQTLAHTRDYLLPKLLSGEVEVKAAEAVV